MASFTASATDIGVYQKSLAATVVDTVTFTGDRSWADVWTDATVPVYVTVDGSTPVAGAQSTYEIPPSVNFAQRRIPIPSAEDDREAGTPGNAVVKLVCGSGTPKYSVTSPPIDS